MEQLIYMYVYIEFTKFVFLEMDFSHLKIVIYFSN